MKQITDHPMSPEEIQRINIRMEILRERDTYPDSWDRQSITRSMLYHLCRQAELDYQGPGKSWAYDLTPGELFDLEKEYQCPKDEQGRIPAGAALAARQRAWGLNEAIRIWAEKWAERARIIIAT